jgi:ArsR family transcriptional regulator, arsenate/arsenite/antimonite-responsive transcriptional repressor
VLHDSGLLEREKRGVWVYYRARTRALASLGTPIGSPPG